MLWRLLATRAGLATAVAIAGALAVLAVGGWQQLRVAEAHTVAAKARQALAEEQTEHEVTRASLTVARVDRDNAVAGNRLLRDRLDQQSQQIATLAAERERLAEARRAAARAVLGRLEAQEQERQPVADLAELNARARDLLGAGL